MSVVEAVPIDKAPGYMIDREGRVWSVSSRTKYPVPLKWQRPEGRRCFYVSVMIDRKPVRFKIARLVLESFHGPQPSVRHVIHHIDGNPLNHRADNLEWTETGEAKRRAQRLFKNRNRAPKEVERELLALQELLREVKLFVARIKRVEKAMGEAFSITLAGASHKINVTKDIERIIEEYETAKGALTGAKD